MANPVVYFLNAKNTNLYKIGMSERNLAGRITGIQVGCPYEVEIECLISTTDARGLESEVHSLLEDHRLRGEWFDLSDVSVEMFLWSYSDSLIKDKDQIQAILRRDAVASSRRGKYLKKKRKSGKKVDLYVKKNLVCKNPDCENLLTGRQKEACSSKCSQKLYRLRKKKATA